MKKFLFLFLLVFLICPILVFAEQIDINSATLSQLDELTGVGPVYAQRIIDGRTYSSLDDLLRVKGIGLATLQKIKTQGWACVNCETSLTSQTTNQPQTTQTTTDQTNNQAPINTDATQTSDTQNPTLATTITYPTGVYINEILPNPQGEDSLDEWIEIFNQNNFEVDISGWKIKDKEGKNTIYIIPDKTKVSPLGFLVFSRPETKITLNNSGDGLNLFYPNEEIADSIDFGKAPLGQSYNKTPSGWFWSTTLTPGAENIVVVPKSPEPSFAPISGASESKGTAALEKKLPESFSFSGSENKKLFTILIAAIIAVFSAIIIFLLKKLNTASTNQSD